MKKTRFLCVMCATLLSAVSLTGCNSKTYHVKFTNGNELVTEKDYKENEEITAPADPEGYEDEAKHKTYTFDGWYDNDVKYEPGLTATKDYNFSATFTEEDTQYHVYFKKSADDANPNVQTLTYGADIVVPDDLDSYKKDHYWYDFVGWFDGDTQLKDGDTCKGDQTFTAKFEQGDLVEYTVTFYDYYGEEISTETGIWEDEVSIPGVLPYVDSEGYDWNFTHFEDEDGETIEEGDTFADTLDHEYYAQYEKGDLHVYTAHIYKFGETDPTDFNYDLSLEGDNSWISVRQSVLACLPNDTATEHYTFGELVPIAAPREYDAFSYNVSKVDKYFEQTDTFGPDSHFKFVDNTDSDAGWNTGMGKIEFTANKGTAYLDTIVDDFVLDFNTSSGNDNRLAIVLGANQDELQTKSFVGGEGTGAVAIDDGLVALSFMPESDTPFKLFYDGSIHEGLNLINKWTKGTMANGLNVHISMQNKVLDISMNGIHLYQENLGDNYKAGYIGFARGSTTVSGPVTHKFTGTFSLTDGSTDKYFSHNYATETNLVGLSSGIDLVNRNQASVGRDDQGRMIFNADTGTSYIQTVNTYEPNVHIKFKAQNIDEYAGGATNDRFTVFFTDDCKKQTNYFSDNCAAALDENGGFGVTLVPGGATIVREHVHGEGHHDQTNVNTPTGNITAELQYEFVVKDGKCTVYINGLIICSFDVPTATQGTKKYIGICGTKKWNVKELEISSVGNQVYNDYSQLPNGYGPGYDISLKNRSGSATATVNEGALNFVGKGDYLYIPNSSTDNDFATYVTYKQADNGRLNLVFGVTNLETNYTGDNSGSVDNVFSVTLMLSSSGKTLRVFDNKSKTDYSKMPDNETTLDAALASIDATQDFVTVGLEKSGSTLNVYVLVGYSPIKIAELSITSVLAENSVLAIANGKASGEDVDTYYLKSIIYSEN